MNAIELNGIYSFSIAATEPGTLNFISNIASISYEVKPSDEEEISIYIDFEGAGSSPDNPLWWDEGIVTISAHVGNKFEPVPNYPVIFFAAGGGTFYDLVTLEELGNPARVFGGDPSE